jgi:hypothetical protein
MVLLAGGCAAEPWKSVDVHVAEIAGREREMDDAAWEASGRREALIDRAARAGCMGDLTIDKRGETWVLEPCGGVLVDVSWSQLLAPPVGISRMRRWSHHFVDVSRDDAPADFRRWANDVELAWGETSFSTATSVWGSVDSVSTGLAGVVERLHRGADDLECPRTRVSLDSRSTRGFTLRFAEGCGRRATYVDRTLIAVVPTSAPDKLSQF